MKTLEGTSTLGAHVYIITYNHVYIIRTSGSRSELSASGTELHSSHSSGPGGRWFKIPLRKPNSAFGLNSLSVPYKFDMTRSWVQDWVQLSEGRMAFQVRKRRQIGHLAFLLLWLRTRRSGVRFPRARHSSLKFSITWAALTTEGWSTSWVHWVQQRCFESSVVTSKPAKGRWPELRCCTLPFAFRASLIREISR